MTARATMKLPRGMTIGETYRPAMEIKGKGEAGEYFQALVERQMQHFGRSQSDAEQLERSNLGYFAGYYDNETRLRVELLFACSHPFFGKAKDGIPTSEEAIEIGCRLGRDGCHK